MSTLHQALFFLHILTGSMALCLFWIPAITRKGSLDHRRYGAYYAKVMYIVAGTGAAMALLVLMAPLTVKSNLAAGHSDPERLATWLRLFWSFLLYLSLITFVSVRQGLVVLNQPHQAVKSWSHRLPIALLVPGGLSMIGIGIYAGFSLFWIFGMLGLFIAYGMLRYSARSEVTKSQRIVEHLGAMIGSGIGAHTAFLAFGARQLMDISGYWQVVTWVAPGVVGSIAITILSRQYTPKTHNVAQN